MKKKFWENRRVFITGSTGLLGYWITKYLVESGALVTALLRKEIPEVFYKTFLNVNIIKGTIIDYNTILSTLQKEKSQTIFHLAAQTISPVANKDPRSTFETNITGTWTVLEACRRTLSIENIIVASSDKAYGENESLPYTEESRLSGIRPYSASKTCADLISQTYFESYKLPLCITRCGNLFGGGDLLDRLVPSVIRAGLLNKKLLIRSDGKFIRDFFYVEDGMLATIKLAEMMCSKKNLVGEAFNFSYEKPITILEIIQMILSIMNSVVKPTILNQATNEIRNQYLSAEKAHRVLKWKPKFSIEEGIEKTIQWYIDYFNKYTVR